ncbi:hypothetical protein LEMLEM_LOCUS7470 [Lemmus lemmus]
MGCLYCALSLMVRRSVWRKNSSADGTHRILDLHPLCHLSAPLTVCTCLVPPCACPQDF